MKVFARDLVAPVLCSGSNGPMVRQTTKSPRDADTSGGMSQGAMNSMTKAEPTTAPSNAPKRKSLGHGLYKRRDGRYEHGFTCTSPHSTCTGGKQHIVTLGAATKTEARKEIAARISRPIQIGPSAATVRQVADEWFATLTSKPRTIEKHEYHLRLNICPTLGYKRVQDVRPQDVAALVVWLKDVRKLAGATAIGALSTLSAVLGHAIWTGLIPSNPVAVVPTSKRPKRKKVVHRALSADEREALLKEGSKTYEPLMYLAVWTGMRECEVLGLIWRDVNLLTGKIHVHAQLSRGNKEEPAKRVPIKTEDEVVESRIIDLDPEMVTWLRKRKLASAHSQDADYVFCTEPNGLPIHWANLVRSFTLAANRAGLNPEGKRRLRFHDLRRTYASVMLAKVDGQSCDEAYVAGQMGCSIEVLRSTYAGLINSEDNTKRGLAAMASARAAGGVASD
jgi:integrase